MHLEMRFERNGDVRPIWYGRFIINGKKECVNLGVPLTGKAPKSLKLKDEGDTEFERSKGAAYEKLKQVVAEAQSTRNANRLLERMYEMKTGVEVRTTMLADLENEWVKLPRRRPLAEKYEQEGRSILGRFVSFVKERNRRAVDLGHVDETAAAAFMEAQTKRGVSARTWNGALKLLRTTFRHLLPSGSPDPFAKLVTREEETVFRKPFTPVELRAILDEAKDDELIRPILVTGMCTAMRRGDCCRLQWKDVDLDRGFVTVKTAKTGGTVSIPIFGLLREELVKRAEAAKLGKAKRGGEAAGFVFPGAAAMYEENPYGITGRVKKVLWAALSKLAKAEAAARGEKVEEQTTLPGVAVEEVRQRGEAYLASLPASERRESMGKVFGEYLGGASVGTVAKSVGMSQSTVSLYLNEIEGQIKCKVVRRAGGVGESVKSDKSLLRVERANGLRRASVRDFHSLRVTWVTLALTAGVPLELVQRVTGHKTTDVVLKHYFRPGQEDFRLALEGAMPKLLTVGKDHETTDHGLRDQGAEGGGRRTEDRGQRAEDGGRPSEVGSTTLQAKEEMREMLATVRPVALRERLLKVWAKL
jgi:integrase